MCSDERMRAYWHPTTQNFGDLLPPIVLRHLGYRPQRAHRSDSGKVITVGSVMNVLRPRDWVWGTGVQEDRRYRASTARILAVRGPITRSCLDGTRVPAVYGDPALLLPEIYSPDVPTVHRVGVMPHYIDASRARSRYPRALFIDVKGGWRRVIRQVMSCEHIITTSLHGVIVADAYGIPCTWHASYTGRIVSSNLKFQDYFLATRGECLTTGRIPPIDSRSLSGLVRRLKEAGMSLPH